MKYFLVQHKKTGRFVAGTDFSYDLGHRQIYADENRPPRLFPIDAKLLKPELARRGIALAKFKLVEIEIGVDEKGREPGTKVHTHTREGLDHA